MYTKIFLHLFDMPMQLSVTLQLTSYIVLGGVGTVLFCAEIKEGIALWKESPVKNGIFFLEAYILDVLLSNLAYLPIMYLNPEYQAVNEHSVAELQSEFPAIILLIFY